jgi:hypothetical protein
MAIADSGFEFEMTNEDRQALLTEAAHRLDVLKGPMAPGGELPQTAEGDFVRTLAEDEGKFARSPIIRKITNHEYLSRNLPVPFNLNEMFKKYRFYFLEFPFELDPAAGWGFNKLEVRIDFNPDGPVGEEQPKISQIFPDPKFEKLFEANANLHVGINANAEFSAEGFEIDIPTGQATFKVKSDAGAEAGGKTGFVIGPMNYSVKRALINHRGTGKEWVRWEIAGTQLNKGDDPRLMVITQVPRQIKQVKIRGQLLASRYFTLANYSLVEAVKRLGDTFRRFFEGGAPYFHRTIPDWDVTENMELSK